MKHNRSQSLEKFPATAVQMILLIILSFLGGSIASTQSQTARATFAGGCFWCVEEVFEHVDGVLSVTSGFTGGAHPSSYKDVSSGGTGHVEAVEIVYDPNRVTYDKLLEVFWKNIDPTDSSGQFCDRGAQYRSAIFYRTEEQKRKAEESVAGIQSQLKGKVVTPILPATEFYPAEAYHQDYSRKNPLPYKQYRIRCGRDRRLRAIWGKAQQQSETGAR